MEPTRSFLFELSVTQKGDPRQASRQQRNYHRHGCYQSNPEKYLPVSRPWTASKTAWKSSRVSIASSAIVPMSETKRERRILSSGALNDIDLASNSVAVINNFFTIPVLMQRCCQVWPWLIGFNWCCTELFHAFSLIFFFFFLGGGGGGYFLPPNVSLIKQEVSFSLLFKAILYSPSWVRKLVNITPWKVMAVHAKGMACSL